jgi:membrane-associated phospholipid phosphatase
VLFVTDFADQAIVLPIVLVVGLAFAAAGWLEGARAWVLVVGTTFFAVLVAKLIVFATAGALPFDTAGLHSPSGHTAAAAVVYGGLLALLAPKRWSGRFLAPVAAGVFALVIGVTRVVLHYHTPTDVLVGGAAGIAGAVVLARLAGDRPAEMSCSLPLAAVAGVMILFHGSHLEVERSLQRFVGLHWASASAMAQERPARP